MPKLRYDLTGKRFGRLTVARYHGMKEETKGRNYWECVCDCGNTTLVDSFSLRNNRIHSCGCARRKYKVGDVFGQITLTGKEEGNSEWIGRCSCGTEMIVEPWAYTKGGRSPMCMKCFTKKYRRRDLTGVRFGRLVGVECVGTDKHRNAIWKFACDCGNTAILRANEIKMPRSRGQHNCGACATHYASTSVRDHSHLIQEE